MNESNWLLKNSQDETVQKCPDAGHPKFACLAARTGKDSFGIQSLPVGSPCLRSQPRGMSRTYGYVAVTKNECNPDASGQIGVIQQTLDI